MDLSSVTLTVFINNYDADIASDEIFLSFLKFCILFGIFQPHLSKFGSTVVRDM